MPYLRLATACLALGLVAWLAWAALARHPQLVSDSANLLSAAEQQRISRFHGLLRKDYGIDYRVVIAPGLEDIDLAAARHYTELEVGSVGDAGRGLLLLLDPARDQVRLEVGYSLESIFIDAFVAYIEQRQMLPFFAAGRVADGILATTELIVERADNGIADAAMDEELWMQGSGGGGASSQARIGAGAERKSTQALSSPATGDSPRSVLKRYQQAMAARNDNPALPIYSQASQKMMADWVVTPAQMDNLARSLQNCPIERELYAPDNKRAVLRAAIAQRKCSPHFFVREDGLWRLDLPAMMQAIRFGRGNQWRLSQADAGAYAFGFVDLRFDGNGFPRQ